MKAARGAAVWTATTALSLLSISCLFELPPLEQSALGGNGGSSGVAGGGSPMEQGGSGGSGVAGAGAGGAGCADGEKLCGAVCQPTTAEFGCASASCEPCGGVPHAQLGCVDGVCSVLSCDLGYADCDGDALNTVGQVAGTGCEYELGVPAPSVAQLEVPFQSITVDGKREDWLGLPSYGFEQVCANCPDQQTEPISADGTVPPRDDLDAQFRVAWDADKLYLLVEAFDNQLVDVPPAEGRCSVPGVCEDALQVFILGRGDRSHNYFNDNKRIFLGLSQAIGLPAQGQPERASDVEVKAERQGNHCYRIEAQLDWAYLTFTQNGGQAPGHFPPAPGQSYGFDIAVNDWDAPVSDPNGLERQSQIFWVDPGPDYAEQPTGIGTMTLLGSGDGGE